MRLPILFAALLLAVPAAAEETSARIARLCASGAAKPVRDPRIHDAIAQAREQHRLFGGQLIDRHGAITRTGFHEAEFDRLSGEATPTWQRVAQFWAAVDPDAPLDFRSPTDPHVIRKNLAEQIASAGRLDEGQMGAVHSALLRTAIVDQPWSAVFISYLVKQANFSSAEFVFSDSHVDYVEGAVVSSLQEAEGGNTEFAYRACDVSRTKPRPGDLLCHTRADSSGTTSYAGLLAELAQRRAGSRPGPYPMHCDLVTRSDVGGDAKIETIGGNVFQSVTLRQMTLNAGKTLGAAYLSSVTPRKACPRSDACGGHLSRRPWVVLLQFRG
jgi:hypothetical protein